METQLEPVSQFEKQRCLERSIYYLMNVDTHGFIGPMLQSMTIKYEDNAVPTAGVYYNQKLRTFEMRLNSQYFCKQVNDLERVAVLKHEIGHLLHGHVYFDAVKLGWDRMLTNVAMDLVINQHINNLPNGVALIKDFKDPLGNPFPPNKTTEYYYDLLTKDNTKVNSKGKGGEPDDSPDNWKDAKDFFKQQGRGGADVHGWEESNVDAEDLLAATADVVKRAMTKDRTGHSVVPDSVKQLLEEIEAKIKELNYTAILLSALKKSLPSRTRRKTWKKESRRYGNLAKGSVKFRMPRIEVFIDTSGSISIEEANEFLDITNNFLTVGVESAHINLFHTNNYYRSKVKKNFKIDRSLVQSGGTDLTSSMEVLKKQRCDLAIVLTDGYFDMPKVNTKGLPQFVFLISKGGSVNHPMAKLGKTMEYKSKVKR